MLHSLWDMANTNVWWPEWQMDRQNDGLTDRMMDRHTRVIQYTPYPGSWGIKLGSVKFNSEKVTGNFNQENWEKILDLISELE